MKDARRRANTQQRMSMRFCRKNEIFDSLTGRKQRSRLASVARRLKSRGLVQFAGRGGPTRRLGGPRRDQRDVGTDRSPAVSRRPPTRRGNPDRRGRRAAERYAASRQGVGMDQAGSSRRLAAERRQCSPVPVRVLFALAWPPPRWSPASSPRPERSALDNPPARSPRRTCSTRSKSPSRSAASRSTTSSSTTTSASAAWGRSSAAARQDSQPHRRGEQVLSRAIKPTTSKRSAASATKPSRPPGSITENIAGRLPAMGEARPPVHRRLRVHRRGEPARSPVIDRGPVPVPDAVSARAPDFRSCRRTRAVAMWCTATSSLRTLSSPPTARRSSSTWAWLACTTWR